MNKSPRIISGMMALFLFVNLAGPTRAQNIIPKGQDLAGVSFDSTIQLRAPLAGETTLLFAHYWVTPKEIKIEVQWAEPHWRSINFALYPVSLRVMHNKKGAEIANPVRNLESGFNPPLGKRGPFGYVYNTYDVEQLRFVPGEAGQARVTVDDLNRVMTGPGNRGESFAGPMAGEESPLKSITGNFKKGRLANLELMGKTDFFNKNIQYEYEETPASRLCKQIVNLSPWPMDVRFPSPIPLTADGKEHLISQWRTDYHRGGRCAEVIYEPVNLQGKKANLATNISVFTSGKENLLRRAAMKNFTLLDKTSLQQMDKSTGWGYGEVSSEERLWRALMLKYWKKDPKDIEAKDLSEIKRLRKLLAEIPVESDSLARQLKRLHMQCMLEILLANEDDFFNLLGTYFDRLNLTGEERITLVSGQELSTLLTQWNRGQWNNKLFPLWLKASFATNSTEGVMGYGLAQVQERHYQIAQAIFGGLLGVLKDNPNLHFTAHYGFCEALFLQLNSEKGGDQGKAKTRQTIQPDERLKLLKTHVEQTISEYERLETKSEASKTMKNHLEKLKTFLMGSMS